MADASRKQILSRLGEAIRECRRSKKISQENLALMAEINRTYMGDVERGEENISVLKLAQIANTLDVSLAELFTKARI